MAFLLITVIFPVNFVGTSLKVKQMSSLICGGGGVRGCGYVLLSLGNSLWAKITPDVFIQGVDLNGDEPWA